MSAQRTERLLNLVIALLATKRWLTKEQIRAAVPQYAASASTEAFDRMFERDKEELRELGIPIETGSHDKFFEDEPGYRIDSDAYALAPIEFTHAELTVLGLAARVWQQASLAGPAARGLQKLKSLGLVIDDSELVGIQPRVTTSEPSFGALYAATRDRVPVKFRYRKEGDAEPEQRHLDPWRIVFWHGRWYVHGFDRGRDAERVFRLSRIVGAVRRAGEPGNVVAPDGLDSRAAVRRVWGEGPPQTAVIDLVPGRGNLLRTRAGVEAGSGVDAGNTRLELEFTDLDTLAAEIAELGEYAHVLEPAALRAAVIERLTAVANGHTR